MSAQYDVHGTDIFEESEVRFEVWPFTENTGCMITDVHKPHLHDFHVAQFVVKGAGKYVIDFNVFDIIPGTVYFVSPGQLHLWEQVENISGFVMVFGEDFLKFPGSPISSVFELDFFHDVSGAPCLAIPQRRQQDIMDLFTSMRAEFEGKAKGYTSVLRAYLHILMMQFQRIRDESPKTGSIRVGRDATLVRRFKHLVSQHYIAQWSVQDYADRLGISVSSLNSMVKEATQLTPGQVIRNEVVMAAKRLLVHSDMSVAEICYQLNFEDPSYFGRFFKRETGFTPAGYRFDLREKYHHFVR